MNTKSVGQYVRYSNSSDGSSVDDQIDRAINALKEKVTAARPGGIAIYCRAGDDSGIKLQRQHELCLDYVAKTFSGLPAPSYYCDPGYDRDALKQLLLDVASGSIAIVVVEDLGRLSRNVVKLSPICEVLERFDVVLHTAAQGVVPLPMLELGLLAKEMRRMQGERLKAGKARAKALREAAVAAE